MINKHISRLGHPLSQNGALYHILDQAGLFQLAVDIEINRAYRAGTIVTQASFISVYGHLYQEQVNCHNRILNEGIPDNLKALLQITDKSEAEKYSKNITISEYELFLLILNCGQLNFNHRSKFPEYVPDDLEIREDDKENLAKGYVKPMSRKLTRILLQRRHIHAHLFERESEWHCFYFSYEDIDPGNRNHWKFGSHLHYINHLWPNYTKDQIWDTFDIRLTKIQRNIHIRFRPFDFDKPDGMTINNPNSLHFEPISATIYGVDPLPKGSSEPTPMAQIATRGTYTIKVKI